MKKKILLVVAVVAVVLVFGGVYLLYDHLSKEYMPNNIAGIEKEEPSEQEDKQETGENEEKAVEYAALNFTVYDKDGKSVELWDFVGKPIVLNFWASWCGPCKSEMPHFEEAYKANPDIEFIMVNATTSSYETLSSAQNYIEDNGYTFPVYYDKDGEAAMKYSVYSLPMTMLIDSDGAPIGYVTGALSADILDQLIEIARTGEVKEIE